MRPRSMTWGANPGYVVAPASTATLSASANDAELDPLTYHWSVSQQPVGASATLATPNAATTAVSGLTAAGLYSFQVNVTNPGHSDLTAQIICTVHPATSAPVISSITVSPSTVTLPASAALLSAVTSGSTNQPLRHWWAVKGAPAGAKPLFEHQGSTNTTVSNLVLPGAYTFTLRAFDDIHMTTQDKTPTVSPAAGAPLDLPLRFAGFGLAPLGGV